MRGPFMLPVASAVAVELVCITCYLAAHGVTRAARADIEGAGGQVRFTGAIAHPRVDVCHGAKATGLLFMHPRPIGRAVADFRPPKAHAPGSGVLIHGGHEFRRAHYL